MLNRKLLLSCFALPLLTASAVWAAPVHVVDDDADWQADAVVTAGVPVVPLPPAVYGSAASLVLIVGIRRSKHRRWLTLR